MCLKPERRTVNKPNEQPPLTRNINCPIKMLTTNYYHIAKAIDIRVYPLRKNGTSQTLLQKKRKSHQCELYDVITLYLS